MDLTNLPQQIADLCDGLEEATETFGRAAHESALADAAFKYAHAFATIKMAEQAVTKLTVSHREAQAMLQCRVEYQTYLIKSAASESAKQHVYSLRNRLDALRTLNANVRTLTGERS